MGLLGSLLGQEPKTVITSQLSRTNPAEDRELVEHIRKVVEAEVLPTLPRLQAETSVIRLGGWGEVHLPCGKATVVVTVHYPTSEQPCKTHLQRRVARYLVCSCLDCSHVQDITLLGESYARHFLPPGW